MKTQEEILAKMEEVGADDFFGTKRGDLLEFLDFKHAKAFLKDEFIKEVESKKKKWNKKISPSKEIKDYMEFAWEKANGCRGLSASRSLEHMQAWLWLDGKDKMIKACEDYQYYGKPQLIMICEEYKIDWKQYDNGVCKNSEEGDGIPTDEVLLGMRSR